MPGNRKLPTAPCRVHGSKLGNGESSNKPKKTMKIKVWQALIPIVLKLLIKVAAVVAIVWVAIHFIRKFW